MSVFVQIVHHVVSKFRIGRNIVHELHFKAHDREQVLEDKILLRFICTYGVKRSSNLPGKLLLGAGSAIYTPRPTAPSAAMVTISNHVPLSHCPKLGLVFQAGVPLCATGVVA